jgi:uncharacterized membrane protein YagU involved in acid resistance
MPQSWKGVIAGFVATLVLSGLFVLFNSTDTLEQLDIVTHIDRLGSIGRGGAWVDHFIVGTLLWGPIFAAFDATSAPRPRWQKGLAFGVIAWIFMMLIFMPVVSGGLFGWRFGVDVPIGMLVLHLIYGGVLGVVFQFLDERFPTKSLLPDRPPQLGGETH